jgi:hypothetical protein
MLNGYAEQRELNSIDVRLLYGLATKAPAVDPTPSQLYFSPGRRASLF